MRTIKINYMDEQVELFIQPQLFQNGDNAIELFEEFEGPFYVMGVVIEGIDIKDDEILLKYYGHNKDIVDEIIKTKTLVQPIGKYVINDFGSEVILCSIIDKEVYNTLKTLRRQWQEQK